jgi:hypothetical protein
MGTVMKLLQLIRLISTQWLLTDNVFDNSADNKPMLPPVLFAQEKFVI